MLSTIPPQPPTLHEPLAKGDNNWPSEPENEPLTIDQLVRQRASLGSSQPIISYPQTGIEYVDYPLHQLDVFAFRASKVLADRIPPRTSSAETPKVVALLGPSDLNYLVMLLSLAKLGHSGLLLSTRISVDAYVSLLERTQSSHIFIHSSFRDTALDIKKRVPGLIIDEIPTEESYHYPITEDVDTNLVPYLDPVVESKHIAWIIHSSGSTGLPKPIFHTQAAALKNYSGHMNMSGFVTLPLYHNHGISCLFRTIHACKQLHLYNANLPLTRQYLIDIMRANDLEIFYGVPYALKLLAETQDGISALAKFKAVMFGGSACPDSLGNLLVENGVHLVSHYGSTETGQLMMSIRPRDDKGWDWLRPSDTVKKFLRFEERFPGVFELVCLDGWPSKVMTNRPDGAYATKDLFVKHPTMEAYKYYARLDDTIVLVNGEKVNPLDLEGRVRQISSVAESIAFGAGKAHIGLAVIRAPGTESLSDEDIIDNIWPAVEKAHESLPAFGQLFKTMVRVLPADTPYPRTDKGTIIRQAFYKTFHSVIEESYAAADAMTGTLVLSEPELRDFLKQQLLQILPLKDQNLLTDDADFFALGMDSLQASQLRSILVQTLNTHGHQLGLNIAFEQPTITLLARYLNALQSGSRPADSEPIPDQMRALIDQFSHFEPHIPRPNSLPGRYILLTGATGSLGSHLAHQLSLHASVQKVYCLIRASSPIEAYQRLHDALDSRHLYTSLPSTSKAKLIALPSPTLAHPTLSLPQTTYTTLLSETTDIIHCAWPVNFNLHLTSLAHDTLPTLLNLLTLALQTHRPTPATFNFCSSISSVVNSPTTPIPESIPDTLTAAQTMGYAQLKLVAEHICANAASQSPSLTTRILRIGQIIGDTHHGIWNATEAIPLMIQSAVTVGALPTLDEWMRWLPVDIVSSAVTDILRLSSPISPTDEPHNVAEVYNIANPTPFHWTADLLPTLRAAGLQFTELEPSEWIARVRDVPDPKANPPVKLVSFWEGKYAGVKPFKGLEFVTEKARERAEGLQGVRGLDGELVGKMVRWFRGVAWV
ncbi:putative NRPS-like enzyme [Aspergillus ibericus CBS 121593]|uniref:Acetyl-CoA synthetase-like protein n=1 Tax=Aspergillus ibericus CBS 121593 TaxID=1448316 RepID=A0A395GL67_9EURO|nr:acetyl-CoA synthetase-like protein [Aspergillus ibericus CBS 121593]RAK96092.1 acetyl-CoA synthetase-like protein [Aspergillus ibericus CBS 121593]